MAKDEQVRSNPQQITVTFEDRVTLSSAFCSGNLSKAVKNPSSSYTYDLWVSSDAAPYIEGDFYRTWFYFSVTGIPQGETATFNFRNLNNQVQLLTHKITFYIR
jgi:hypothetical protein